MQGSPMTRRRFVAGAGSLAAATVFAPQALANGVDRAPTLTGGGFPDGVLSGDPTPTGITLWSRVADVGGSGTVELEVARDRGFRRVVARELIGTGASLGHTVKARIGGLDPYEEYYYRFSTRSADSRLGRFRTALPPDSRQPVRLAFISCQEYTFGYFNAHALLRDEDVDFVVNLGDYIYSDLAFPRPVGVRDADFPVAAGGTAVTVDQYRARYRIYRSDRLLRDVHAAFPMISTWDDHEVQNDYAGGDPQGGDIDPGRDPYSKARRDRAYAVFFENMPTYAGRGRRSRLFHKASFGSIVDLFVLDERQYRAAQPCLQSGGFACPELDDPRAFLGPSQLQFARSGIKRSKAAWKVIANEVPIMRLFSEENRYQTFDIWQGYPVEREALLRTIRDGVDDVVFITGDYHVFIAGDVRTADGTTVATEFVGGSITSASDVEVSAIIGRPGYGTPDAPRIPPAELARIRSVNPWLADFDTVRHGYVVCEASSESFRTTFKKLETVRRRSTELSQQRTWTIPRGRAGVVEPRST